MRGVTLSSLPQLVWTPHSRASRSLLFGALPPPFPAISVVPAVNYYRLLSLTRLLRASGPFSLRSFAGETAAPQFGIRGHPVLFFTTPHRMVGLGSSLDSSPSAGVLPSEALAQFPFVFRHHLRLWPVFTCSDLRRLPVGATALAFVTVR